MSLLLSFLPALRAGVPLDEEQAGAAVETLLDPTIPDSDRAAFLSALADKGETADELASFTHALLPRAIAVEPPASLKGPLFDCCGTGGGGLPLFNVSTALAFLLASLGIPVAKHGNRGVTKACGSIDVVEALGVRAAQNAREAEADLAACGLTFLYAPAFHPAFTAVAAVRKSLGRRTIFNLLGPLLNPCRPKARLIGVFRDTHVPLYAEALEHLGAARYLVAYGLIGGQPIGEISPTGENFFESSPPLHELEEMPWRKNGGSLDGLLVADAAQSAALIETLLRDEGGEPLAWGRELLRWNAALSCAVQGRTATVAEGLALVDDALREKAGWAKLEQARAFH